MLAAPRTALLLLEEAERTHFGPTLKYSSRAPCKSAILSFLAKQKQHPLCAVTRCIPGCSAQKAKGGLCCLSAGASMVGRACTAISASHTQDVSTARAMNPGNASVRPTGVDSSVTKV